MLIRIITLRFNTAMDGFDDSPLIDFIKDKAVLSFEQHFFIRNETPYLTIVVIYEPLVEPTLPSKQGEKYRQRDESWRSLIKESEMPLFDSLRSWRSERCKKEGIPPYLICNNKQLAQIVAMRPQSLSQLMQIEGIGKAKTDSYGLAILEFFQTKNEQSTNENKQT